MPDTPTTLGRLRVQVSTKQATALESRSGRFTIQSGGPVVNLPTITRAFLKGPKLMIEGSRFQDGAIVEMNGADQKTVNLDPPDQSLRVVTDMIEWSTRELPRMHPVSISGYHIREAGSTAAQELAFTLANGFTYVERAIERGLGVDEFAPRLSFFFNAHLDFFEEIAKYRAARRIWARELRERFGAKDERSLLMRFHTQTAGVSLTAQQPEVNIVRTAIEALAAVLGGTQSLHTNSFDEALALPSEDAVRIAGNQRHPARRPRAVQRPGVAPRRRQRLVAAVAVPREYVDPRVAECRGDVLAPQRHRERREQRMRDVQHAEGVVVCPRLEGPGVAEDLVQRRELRRAGALRRHSAPHARRVAAQVGGQLGRRNRDCAALGLAQTRSLGEPQRLPPDLADLTGVGHRDAELPQHAAIISTG